MIREATCPTCNSKFTYDVELGLNVAEFRPTIPEIAALREKRIEIPPIGKLLGCCPNCDTLVEDYRVHEDGKARIVPPKAGLLTERNE